jgi:hypothetical protein
MVPRVHGSVPHGSHGELQGRSSQVHLHVVVYVIGFPVRAVTVCVGRRDASYLQLAQMLQRSMLSLSRSRSARGNNLRYNVLHVSVLSAGGCMSPVSCASRVNTSDAAHVSQSSPHIMTCAETTSRLNSSGVCFPNVDMQSAPTMGEQWGGRGTDYVCGLSPKRGSLGGLVSSPCCAFSRLRVNEERAGT